MSTLIHADVFFFVTTIAVVVVAVLAVIALVYVIQILRGLRDVTAQVNEEMGRFREDLHTLREKVISKGFKIRHMLDFLLKLFYHWRPAKKKK